MGQPARLEESRPWSFFSYFAIALRSCTTRQSSYVNLFVNPTEQNELAGAQDLGGRSDAGSDKAPTPSEAPTLPLVFLSPKDLFTKFMKVFMKMTQAQT